MKANEVREKYLKFFEKRGHKRIAPAPLVLKDDPTTLFTSSGMQPLVPYLMGKEYSGGFTRLVDSQPSLRAQDIEEVGDNRHTTFFEMLGNWSLGDYFKKEQIAWVWEFITQELKLPKEKLYVSVFEGDDKVPEDKETIEIWKSLGIPDDHIFKYGVKKNWWSRSGTPDQMPVGEIGGCDSEIFYEFTHIKHDEKFGEKCHPNCDCGRFMEICNSVFMQYKKIVNGLEELPKKNVDFGGGLERFVCASENSPDVYVTSCFSGIINAIEKFSGREYGDNSKFLMRIVADHMKASTFLICDGVVPSNKLQGYILRRLLRRALVKVYFLMGDLDVNLDFGEIIKAVFETYEGVYLDYKKQGKFVEDVIRKELNKFNKNLKNGIDKLNKTDAKEINEQFAFDLMQSEGFPFEITAELAKEKGIEIDKNKFDELVKEHQELSRASSAQKFKINKR